MSGCVGFLRKFAKPLRPYPVETTLFVRKVSSFFQVGEPVCSHDGALHPSVIAVVTIATEHRLCRLRQSGINANAHCSRSKAAGSVDAALKTAGNAEAKTVMPNAQPISKPT